jgi:hypothetical protein
MTGIDFIEAVLYFIQSLRKDTHPRSSQLWVEFVKSSRLPTVEPGWKNLWSRKIKAALSPVSTELHPGYCLMKNI